MACRKTSSCPWLSSYFFLPLLLRCYGGRQRRDRKGRNVENKGTKICWDEERRDGRETSPEELG